MQDVATQKCAYSIGNIMQSAQLNRELPPMHTYNFMPLSECDLKEFAPVVDDICAAGNLQDQLEGFVADAVSRKKAFDEQQLEMQKQQQMQQQNVSQSVVNNQSGLWRW